LVVAEARYRPFGEKARAVMLPLGAGTGPAELAKKLPMRDHAEESF